MYLEPYGLRIERKHLTRLSVSGDQTIHFIGRALEEEGERICEQLSKFNKGQIVEVDALTQSLLSREGIYEIIELEFPSPTLDKAPAIYRFKGRLKSVY